MSPLSDILALLDRWPTWKAITGLPDRVGKLEERIAALEAAARKPSGPATEPCPICGGEMKTTKVEADPIFGRMGLQRQTLACASCSHTENRQIDPKKR